MKHENFLYLKYGLPALALALTLWGSSSLPGTTTNDPEPPVPYQIEEDSSGQEGDNGEDGSGINPLSDLDKPVTQFVDM